MRVGGSGGQGSVWWRRWWRGGVARISSLESLPRGPPFETRGCGNDSHDSYRSTLKTVTRGAQSLGIEGVWSVKYVKKDNILYVTRQPGGNVLTNPL